MEMTDFSGARVGKFSPGGIAGVSHGDDANLLVLFKLVPVRQGGASEKAGRDIFKDEEYVWIRFPGDKTKEVMRPVDLRGSNGHPPDPERWPKAWAAFKNSQVQAQEGTPIENLPGISASTALNFKAFNVHTVEQLVSVSDAVIHNLGTGAMDLRERARTWLKAATDASVVTSLQAELAKRDTDIAALQEQIKDLAKQIEKGKK